MSNNNILPLERHFNHCLCTDLWQQLDVHSLPVQGQTSYWCLSGKSEQMIYLHMTITAHWTPEYMYYLDRISAFKIEHTIVPMSMIIGHYRLLGIISVNCISAAEQAVRTLKLDREPNWLAHRFSRFMPWLYKFNSVH